MLVVVGKDDRPKPAVVIFRDAADEPCRILAHYSLQSLLFDEPHRRGRAAMAAPGGRGSLVFSGTLAHRDRSGGWGSGLPRSLATANKGIDLGGCPAKWSLTALCSRWPTTRRMGEDAPFR